MVFHLSAGDRLPSVPALRSMLRETVRARVRARAYPHANGMGGVASEKRGSNTISDRSSPQQLATDDPGVLF